MPVREEPLLIAAREWTGLGQVQAELGQAVLRYGARMVEPQVALGQASPQQERCWQQQVCPSLLLSAILHGGMLRTYPR